MSRSLRNWTSLSAPWRLRFPSPWCHVPTHHPLLQHHQPRRRLLHQHPPLRATVLWSALSVARELFRPPLLSARMMCGATAFKFARASVYWSARAARSKAWKSSNAPSPTDATGNKRLRRCPTRWTKPCSTLRGGRSFVQLEMAISGFDPTPRLRYAAPRRSAG